MSRLQPSLARPLDRQHYWQTVYRQPLADWLPVIEHICQRHQLAAPGWERFALGRNIVFGNATLVLKLSQPDWAFEIPREADALQFVYGRLPVATPELIATGELDGWAYLIQRRLPGDLLRVRRADLPHRVQVALAEQQGALMAALHQLPVDRAPATLAFDWGAMLTEQQAECEQEMRTADVPSALLADLAAYLAQAEALLAADDPAVILHGDLDAINLLVEERNGQWQITGLVDWGDVKLGPLAHDFISPGIHSYRGQRELLQAWYAGYGLRAEQRTVAFMHNIMARSLLYYAGEFAHYLQSVPGAEGCQSWTEVADCFWHLG